MTRPKLTEKQIERWKDLIRWAWDADVPFDMKAYRESDFENPVCDTVACFLGHSTRFAEQWGVEVPRSHMQIIDFDAFSRSVLGVNDLSDWDWLFSDEWRGNDNTLRGAVKRAIYWLRYGTPDDWDKQLFLDAPLCYTNETLEGLEDVK